MTFKAHIRNQGMQLINLLGSAHRATISQAHGKKLIAKAGMDYCH
jgi:hypothetical protein